MLPTNTLLVAQLPLRANSKRKLFVLRSTWEKDSTTDGLLKTFMKLNCEVQDRQVKGKYLCRRREKGESWQDDSYRPITPIYV